MSAPDSTPFDLALEGFQLGDSDTVLRLDGPDEFARATLALVAQTRRELCIVSPDFEPERFNNADFASALTRLARRSRHAEIRILVGDPTIAVRWGHKVVALSHRISSTLRIRQLDEEDFDPQQAWMVADDIGLLRRDNAEVLKGSLVARAIPHGQRASEKFTQWWDRSREIADFRQLHI
ncbi:MAG: hypothetical protein K0Q68_1899 [Moraxellaceae bacterium]|jgi:hypothetical protein|nr:hypothetical protein [Moraxellaceae bacterium]